MRILMYPPAMRIGGSQLNAVELAEEMQRRGNDVVVFAQDGPLRPRVEAAGLPFEVASPRPKVRPWPPILLRLNEIVRRYRIDLVHGYEWPPIIEAVYGPFMRYGTPVVATVMSMGVAPFIPRHLPLVVGTAQIAQIESRHRKGVELVEPPVDVELNRPGVGGLMFRSTLGVGPTDILVVVVSRLAEELKREGLVEAVRATGSLARNLPLQLVIVGDGPARAGIERLASIENAAAGRQVVTLTGAVLDPRPMYDAADVVLGMGSSALRGMAFAKPLVVQGERGFWRLLEPDSLDTFLRQGWYGIGDGPGGADRLADILRGLSTQPALRSALGEFGRSVVLKRFSLTRAGALHEQIYRDAIAGAPSRLWFSARATGPLGAVGVHEAKLRIAQLRHRAVTEDFNSITAQARPEPEPA